MILAEINLDESQELEFNINISGSKEEPSDIRFIIENDNFGIMCRAFKLGDSIRAYIPKLKHIFKSGEYTAKLEIVLENRLFVPLKEKIKIAEEITIQLTDTNSIVKKETNNPEIQVTLSKVLDDMFNDNITNKDEENTKYHSVKRRRNR